MNSDLYQDPDFLGDQFLDWLLEKSAPSSFPTPEGGQNQEMSAQDADYLLSNANANASVLSDDTAFAVDPLDWEELEMNLSNPDDAIQNFQSLDMGDIPQVQTRFQTLLKRKLQREIELRPPLFPWETELSDYEPEYRDALERKLVPLNQGSWLPQLANLQLLVPMPEQVLSQLLEACSEAMQLAKPQPSQLVNALSNLFPNQQQSLNNIAVVGMTYGEDRYGDDANKENSLLAKEIANINYETASARQQMVLSYLAAREIMDNLTLTLSPKQSTREQEWQTSAGVVTIQAAYEPYTLEGSSLKVRVKLPRGGSVSLGTPEASTKAQRTYPGYVSVELCDWQSGINYPLEICLPQGEQKPLTFTIKIQE